MNTAKSPFPQHLAPFFGCNGVHVATGTGYRTGPFYSIYVLNDAVFTTIDMPSNDGDSLDGLNLVAGQHLDNALGIRGFELASGEVIAYRG